MEVFAKRTLVPALAYLVPALSDASAVDELIDGIQAHGIFADRAADGTGVVLKFTRRPCNPGEVDPVPERRIVQPGQVVVVFEFGHGPPVQVLTAEEYDDVVRETRPEQETADDPADEDEAPAPAPKAKAKPKAKPKKKATAKKPNGKAN